MIGKTFALAAAVAFIASSGANAATGPEGTWLTQYDGGLVGVSACGDALCGRILGSQQTTGPADPTDVHNQNPALRNRPLKGLLLFSGVKGGPSEWTGGSVYNPEDGKTYHGSIKLVDADTLKLTGCVFYPLCQSQTWTRVK